MEAIVSNSVSHSMPSVRTSSLVNVHCNEALVWFEVSGYCDTINTSSSLGLLLVILLLPCVMEILQFWLSRTNPFSWPNSSQMMNFVVGQLKAWVVGSLGDLLCLHCVQWQQVSLCVSLTLPVLCGGGQFSGCLSQFVPHSKVVGRSVGFS